MPLPARLAAALALVACSATAQPSVVAEEAFPGVTFQAPVGVETVAVPGEPARFFVVEQGGGSRPSRIQTLREGDTAPTVFLDLSDRVVAGGEAGLLGLAFHPDYVTNGRLFVYYTGPVDTPEPGVRVFESRLSEFARSTADPLTADPASERVLLRVDQPADNHNGGTVDFGADGLLYLGLGDGGGQGDQYGNGQNLTTLLGAILRLDVDRVPAGDSYGIPPDNPFAAPGGGERPEIWAWGFRNPYRFDAGPDGVWVGDVGQDRWEEVDRVEGGRNYGWDQVEGPECYRSGCDLGAFAAPVLSYRHDRGDGESITGGFVVRLPDSSLDGHYLYGDFLSGRVWAYDIAGGSPHVLVLETVPAPGGPRAPLVASIDEGDGVPLLTDYLGRIYRLVPGGTDAAAGPERPVLGLRLTGPNPAAEGTSLAVEAEGPVTVTLADALGRTVAVLWEGPAPGRLAVDLRAVAPGVYTAVARSAGAVATARIVVAR